MLQQTQVERVEKHYRLFLKSFPTPAALAEAPFPKVLGAWQGLGYNRRALALKRLAEIVEGEHRGKIPRDLAGLERLPGIGHSTAGAILAFAFNVPVPFIETNIRRAYLHFFFKGKEGVSDKEVLSLVTATLDRKDPRTWYWALMDYGSSLGRSLPVNPNRRSAAYRRQAPFQGSERELRGKILRMLGTGSFTVQAIESLTRSARGRVQNAIGALEKEGFLEVQRNKVKLAK